MHSSVAAYYARRLAEHGPTPQGVDWKDASSQELRFRELLMIFDGATDASILDAGCGYAALLDYMRRNGFTGRYIGLDLSTEMITAAKALHESDNAAEFHVGDVPPAPAAYVVASGIFNVRMEFRDDEWLPYVHEVIATLDRFSTRGFAFNCLTSYSDREFMRPDLFYANPSSMLEHCLDNYSRRVAVLHDYDLYEFTMLVRKHD